MKVCWKSIQYLLCLSICLVWAHKNSQKVNTEKCAFLSMTTIEMKNTGRKLNCINFVFWLSIHSFVKMFGWKTSNSQKRSRLFVTLAILYFCSLNNFRTEFGLRKKCFVPIHTCLADILHRFGVSWFKVTKWKQDAIQIALVHKCNYKCVFRILWLFISS